MRLSAVKSFSEVIAKLFFAAGISQFLLQKRRGAKLTMLYPLGGGDPVECFLLLLHWVGKLVYTVGVRGAKWVEVERRTERSRRSSIKGYIELMFMGEFTHAIDDKGRLTVDTSEDFELMQKVYERCYRPDSLVDFEEVGQFLAAHPEIKAINQNIQQKKSGIF